MSKAVLPCGGDLTGAFFKQVRKSSKQDQQVQLVNPPSKKSPLAQLHALMQEMDLVWKRHQQDLKKCKESAGDEMEASAENTRANPAVINWNQVMAYFKGKALGIMGQVTYISNSHKEALLAASKLFETQMACFVKAYRDQQLALLKKQAKPKPARKIRPVNNQAAKGEDRKESDGTAGDVDVDENDDHQELIQEQQVETNMENVNKVIFELSTLIQ